MSYQVESASRWGAPDWIAPVYDPVIWFITQIGNVTGLGYQVTNLVVFVLVQPLLILLFMFLWLKDRRKSTGELKSEVRVGSKRAFLVIGLLVIGGLVIYQGYDPGYEMEFTSRFGQPDWVRPVYNWGVAVMQQVGAFTGLGYYVVNLILFVLIQPALIVLFFTLWRRARAEVRTASPE